MNEINQLKEWFAQLESSKKRNVLRFLYGDLLITRGNYCGPRPEVIQEGLYSGPVPSVSEKTCSMCGKPL